MGVTPFWGHLIESSVFIPKGFQSMLCGQQVFLSYFVLLACCLGFFLTHYRMENLRRIDHSTESSLSWTAVHQLFGVRVHLQSTCSQLG